MCSMKRRFAFAAALSSSSMLVNCVHHQAGHGFIATGGIDAEPPQQGLGKTQRDILVRLFHVISISPYTISANDRRSL
jgi:hypothetical protein